MGAWPHADDSGDAWAVPRRSKWFGDEGRGANHLEPSPARLSLAEREEIRVGLEHGHTFTAIAAVLGRAVSSCHSRFSGSPVRARPARFVVVRSINA